MARQPMVTRTITTTTASVFCVNIKEEEPFNQLVTLPRTYKDAKAMLKAAKNIIDNDEVKAVSISKFEVNETLYGMTEQEFINTAHPMPGKKTEAANENAYEII